MRLIIYAILAFIIYYLLKGFSKGSSSKRPESPPFRTNEAGKELKRDPVCGTYIPEDTPYRLKYQGVSHFFCSEECMKTFRKKIAEEKNK